MLDKVSLTCPQCNHHFHQSVPYIQGQIKAMKLHKRDEVAQQMHDKCGPFYDQWKAAMDLRGEQKRCRGCRSRREDNRCTYLTFKRCAVTYVNPGQFACGYYDEGKPG